MVVSTPRHRAWILKLVWVAQCTCACTVRRGTRRPCSHIRVCLRGLKNCISRFPVLSHTRSRLHTTRVYTIHTTRRTRSISARTSTCEKEKRSGTGHPNCTAVTHTLRRSRLHTTHRTCISAHTCVVSKIESGKRPLDIRTVLCTLYSFPALHTCQHMLIAFPKDRPPVLGACAWGLVPHSRVCAPHCCCSSGSIPELPPLPMPLPDHPKDPTPCAGRLRLGGGAT